MNRVAVLDDYRDLARALGAWDTITPGIELTAYTEKLLGEDIIARTLEPFEVLVLNRERTPFPASLLDRLPNLRFVTTFGSRNAALDFAALAARGISVSGTIDEVIATPEFVWAQILGLARNLAAEDRAIREGRWQTREGVELRGKVLGFLGLGRIGGEAARIGAGFGMEMIAWSKNLTAERCAEIGNVTLAAGKEDLLRRADIVVVALTGSARTRGMIGGAELALMKPTAFMINLSRSYIVDQNAVVAALEAGTIAGAALDVFDEEPIPQGHPLLARDDVLLTPHIGNLTTDLWRRRFGQIAENIQAWQDGSPIRVIEDEDSPLPRG